MKILIITHYFATGPTQELRDYLKDKVDYLGYIEHPFSYCSDRRSSITTYIKRVSNKKRSFFNLRCPALLYYLKDFLLTMIYALRLGLKFDIAIAADNLNAFSAILLKKLGRINKVIYFTIDYTPQRFKNSILNAIYHRIDRFCLYHADLMWNDSKLMETEREKAGIPAKDVPLQMVVPGGNHFSRIKRLSLSAIDRHSIVYMGHVLYKQGLDLVLEALPELKREVPGLKLVVIGKGEYLKELIKKAKDKGVEEYVDFKGYIDRLSQVEEILAKCAVGVAPYMPDPSSVTLYSDSGKPRIYMACGLPIIITRVSSISKDVESNRLGVAIEYKKEDFIKAALRLLKDDAFYSECRNNSIEFASSFDWSTIFKGAMSKSLEYLRMNK